MVMRKREVHKGMSRYKKAKLWAEQLFLARVERYIFPGEVKYRMPRYRWKRLGSKRKYFSLKLSGREVEKIFQFRKPFRGKAGFRVSAYHPEYGLVDDVSINGCVRDLK